MSSNLDPLAPIERQGNVPPPAPPSKGPPPLPKVAAAPTGTVAAELVFEEGIDGHAESLPPDAATPLTLDDDEAFFNAVTVAAPHSEIPPTSLDDDWVEAEEEIEDPARTRRRRRARLGTAWGAALLVTAASVAGFVGHRRDARSVTASADSVPVEGAAAHASATTTPNVPASPPPTSAQPVTSSKNASSPTVVASASPKHARCHGGKACQIGPSHSAKGPLKTKKVARAK